MQRVARGSEADSRPDLSVTGPSALGLVRPGSHANRLLADSKGRPTAVMGWAMPGESVTSVRVRPAKFVERVGAEITERLKGRLKARVETKGDRVLVRTQVETQADAAAAKETVKDVAIGVRQTLGLDALDLGESRISIRVE